MTKHRRLAKRLGRFYFKALMLVKPFREVIEATPKREQRLFRSGLADIAEAAILREWPIETRN